MIETLDLSALRPPESWAEWQQQGTQRDGRPHLARGIVIFTIAHGRIVSNRFYVHPVRSGPPNVLGG